MQFDTDTKIELNKERLSKDIQEIRSIQNSYPLYFAYLAFIGLNLIEAVKYLKGYQSNKIHDNILLVLSILTILITAISIWKFIQLLYPKEIHYDKLPKEVYNDYYSELEEHYGSDYDELNEETKKGYLEYLELSVEQNFKLYAEKRQLLYQIVVIALISLIPYISLIIVNFIYNG